MINALVSQQCICVCASGSGNVIKKSSKKRDVKMGRGDGYFVRLELGRRGGEREGMQGVGEGEGGGSGRGGEEGGEGRGEGGGGKGEGGREGRGEGA